MKRFLVVLFAGAAAVFASCNDEETGKENKWFYAPEAGVSGTTVEVSCRTKFGDGVLSSAQAGFAYAPIGAADGYFDAEPVEVRPWTQLDHVRAYYELFQAHGKEFEAQS